MSELQENRSSQYDSELVKEESGFDIKVIWALLLRYKYWIAVSVVVCMGLAWLYLRYTTPVYQVSSKMLIKDREQRRSYNSSISNTFSELGFMNSSNGFDNEIEVLATRTLNKLVVRKLKLYTSYYVHGRIRTQEVYRKYSPYIIDMALSLLSFTLHSV